MKKRILNLICCMVLVVSIMAQPIFATGIENRALPENPSVEPMWNNVLDISCTTSDQEGDLGIDLCMNGYPGTVFTNISISVYKMSGTDVGLIERWVGITCNDYMYRFSETVPATLDGEFKIAIRVTTLNNGVSETISHDFYRTFP